MPSSPGGAPTRHSLRQHTSFEASSSISSEEFDRPGHRAMRRVVHASMSGIISGRLENTVDATHGQPLAARVLARKDELEDALVDLQRSDALERQAIETALATVYATTR